MKAFILCGGEGTRLRPYTYETPKPLLKIGGKPILNHVIENLQRADIDEYILTAGYLADQFVSYVGDGSSFGSKVTVAVETEKLNTAGSILPHKDKVEGTFVVVMGDHITNLHIADMIEHHKKSGAVATVALLKHETKLEFGVAEVEDGHIKEFREKPVLEHLFNIAIYVFEPKIFDYIGEKEDFAKDVFPKMLRSGEKINAYIFDGLWHDIGHKSEYDRLNEEPALSKLLEDLKK